MSKIKKSVNMNNGATKSKRLAVAKNVKQKSVCDEASISIALCLEGFLNGLHLGLIIGKEGEDRPGFMDISMHGKQIGLYEVEWTENINPEHGGFEIQAQVTGVNELAE